jgi:glycosyltransferase involved in cell wall biosynthesis
MARGRPVVATNVGGVSDLIEDERSGLVVPPESPVALGGTLARLLSDRQLAEPLGAEARVRILERDPLAEYESGVARLAAWAREVGCQPA